MCAFFFVCFVLVLAYGIFFATADFRNKREIDLYVTKTMVKEQSVEDGDGHRKYDGVYLVTGKDREGNMHSYKIQDVYLKGKFNSTDIFGSIEEGKCYHIVSYGDRIPWMSVYPNIYSATEIVSFTVE